MRAQLEHITDPEPYSVKAFLRREREGFPLFWHYHPEIELTLILSGRGRRLVGNHMTDFGPGDLVLLGGNLPHAYASYPASGMATAIVVQFLRTSVPDFPELKEANHLIDFAERGCWFPEVGDALSTAIHGLTESVGLIRLHQLQQILDTLSRMVAHPLAQPDYQRPSGEREPDQAERLIRFLHDNFRRPLTLNEIAGHLYLSPSATGRLCRRVLGYSPIAYLQQLRCGEAARLLRQTKLSIGEVGLRAGFRSSSNFNRIFGRYYGSSPGQYRRLIP